MPIALFRSMTLLVALCIATTSHAGRPLVTEDAGVLEKGSCELETYARRLTERAAPSSNGFSLQYGCGVGMRTQVALAATMDRADGATVRGLAFGGKTSISDGGEADPSWTLAWGLTAEKSPGASLGHETTWLNGVFSMPLGKDLKLHANLGWTRAHSTHQSTTGWAVALERSTASGIWFCSMSCSANCCTSLGEQGCGSFKKLVPRTMRSKCCASRKGRPLKTRTVSKSPSPYMKPLSVTGIMASRSGTN